MGGKGVVVLEGMNYLERELCNALVAVKPSFVGLGMVCRIQ